MCPTKDTILTGSLSSLILDYLATHPGEHRCHAIATAIGRETQETANECARQYRRGAVERRREIAPTTGALTITLYSKLSDPPAKM